MKLPQLEPQLTRTVWIRKNGRLRAVRVPEQNIPKMPSQPMFPIARPPHDQQ
jgi:hypothetical protein